MIKLVIKFIFLWLKCTRVKMYVAKLDRPWQNCFNLSFLETFWWRTANDEFWPCKFTDESNDGQDQRNTNKTEIRVFDDPSSTLADQFLQLLLLKVNEIVSNVPSNRWFPSLLTFCWKFGAKDSTSWNRFLNKWTYKVHLTILMKLFHCDTRVESLWLSLHQRTLQLDLMAMMWFPNISNNWNHWIQPFSI